MATGKKGPVPAHAEALVSIFNALNEGYISMGDLTKNIPFELQHMERVETQHGARIKADLLVNGQVKSYLLSCRLTALTDDQLTEYNQLSAAGWPPTLTYLGRNESNNSFNVKMDFPY